MVNRVNQTYKIEGSRVYGEGVSYNCTNIVTAKDLCHRLNQYEHDLALQQSIGQKLDKIEKQTIQIQIGLKILEDDINKLKQTMEE